MAIEAEALRDALRLALKFVDRAGGEGIMFLADDHNGYTESDAADVCVSVAEALGIEFAGSDYMALIGDGPLPSLIHRSALAEDTARAAEGQIPEGWKLVPVEPTDDMMIAALELDDMSIDGRYRAMLAAAPALPLDKEAADANR